MSRVRAIISAVEPQPFPSSVTSRDVPHRRGAVWLSPAVLLAMELPLTLGTTQDICADQEFFRMFKNLANMGCLLSDQTVSLQDTL
jgi:hypothetical protein